MNLGKRWELATAVGAALVTVMVLGRGAHAERLWTERPAELRSSPGDDSQVVKRVGKGRSLEVVKRLGTWVQVEYEGRTGWIRRTALSTEPVSGGSADAGDKEKSDKKEARKSEADEGSDDAGSTKPAAAGAKRTAAKKKADRRKSRKDRRADEESETEDEDVVADKGKSKKSKGKSSDEDEEEATSGKSRRPRSTWAARGRLPGGPLKVEIQALSVQAFEEPDGTGRVVFTAGEGDSVRVIARGENRWLLVENGKKRTGWIPAVAVRDHGLLLEARKDVSKSSKDEAEADEPKDEDEEVKEDRTAAASDGDSEDGEISEDASDGGPDEGSSSKSDDETDTSLTSSADDEEMESGRKDWSATGSLHGGFAAVGMDATLTGAAAQEATYSGPTAGLTAEFAYRLNPRLHVLADLAYDVTFPTGGLTYTSGGTEVADIKLTHHRVGISTGVAYGKSMMGIARVGYQYAALNINDIANDANLPREATQGPTFGLGFAYPKLAGQLGVRLGVDALLFGSRSQTEGSADGTELESLLSVWGTAGVDYPIGQHLTLGGGYRFGYTTAKWAGMSERTTGAMATERKDQAHEVAIGVGWRL
jgi:uncharacterized protein YgiM (DUF1202 family)